MGIDSHKTQKINDGYGPVYHRIYSVTFKALPEKVKAAMLDLKADMNQFSPQILARFEKVTGNPGELQNNDEFLIHITGPWNGPVRVVDVTEEGYKLKTLEGHLEAGEIKFAIKNTESHTYTFQIESLARSRDAIVDLVYDKVPIAKAAQTEMWTLFCKNVAEKILGPDIDKAEVPPVEVLTERLDEETGQWQKL